MRLTSFVGICSMCLSLAGCVDPVSPRMAERATPIAGPSPEMNQTPMETALSCMRGSRNKDIRIGVSEFSDGTGAYEGLGQNARVVSQRPDMMMVVALKRGGAHLVNRNAVAVSEWEMKQAIEKKLGDGRLVQMGEETVDYRPIKMGTVLGSTHYVTGSITELNWNIDSGVLEGGAYSLAAGARTYRISIAIDVVVTDTLTTEIVHAQSYRKQLVGIETNANFFRFFTQTAAVAAAAAGGGAAATAARSFELFNANLSHKKNEPVQGALRWLIEIAAYDMLRSLRGGSGSCDHLLPPGVMEDGPAHVAERSTHPATLRPELAGSSSTGHEQYADAKATTGWAATIKDHETTHVAQVSDDTWSPTIYEEPRQ